MKRCVGCGVESTRKRRAFSKGEDGGTAYARVVIICRDCESRVVAVSVCVRQGTSVSAESMELYETVKGHVESIYFMAHGTKAATRGVWFKRESRGAGCLNCWCEDCQCIDDHCLQCYSCPCWMKAVVKESW